MQNNKKAQVTILVILAIVFVALIIFLFVFKVVPKIVNLPSGESSFDVQSYLQECTNQYVTEAVEQMLPRGGFLTPKNFVRFNSTIVEYICLNVQNYYPCIQQHPMLLYEMKHEIKNYISPRIDNCLLQMADEYESRGAKVTFLTATNIQTDWGMDKIFVEINKKINIKKQDETRAFDNFKVEVQSPAYNLAIVAVEIASQEGDPEICHFDPVGYSLTYPRYKIELYNEMPDSTKIYTINDKKSKQFMRMATRSCTIPRGL